MKDNIKFIDLQVNGYAGIDFNSMILTEEQLLVACKKLEEDNVEGILATLITDDFNKMIDKIKNITSIIEGNDYIKSIIKGIHIEGPFLNSNDGYRGAHQREFIIPPDLEMAKQMFDSANGLIKLFTLAPECDDNFSVTKFLSKNNVLVSAGHSDASLDQLNEAIDSGLKLYTHLGNGSPSFLPRHDNIVNRVLSLAGKISICFISDGIHIPTFVLKNYLNAAGMDNCIIVTDCMSAASAPPGIYSVSHISVEVGEDKIVRQIGKDNLAGSAITMKETEKILSEQIGLSNSNIRKIMYENAQILLGRK
ncbi:MAG: N-acetylglucosamine-6-phosphate deacetylase [Ignavibacteriae bacterium]|nr:N-acetylglucosamine-6-phosphate deacetylase [Ignavibacteriota bacterium]